MKPAAWIVAAALLAACSAKDHGEEKGHAHGHGDDAGGAHDEGEEVVALAPEAQKAADLRVAEAKRRPLTAVLTAPARVEFTQTGVARVAPRVPGRIDAIEVRLGQKVQKGAVLGYIESPELGEARAKYLAAATRARVASDNHRREKELHEKGITSEREMREAESASAAARAEMTAAEATLHTLGLSDPEIEAFKLHEHPSSRFATRSPIAGTVVEILTTIGQTVESTTHLFTVGDLSKLWVVLDVADSQLAGIRESQEVEIGVAAIPGRRFTGRIEHVGDVVDERTSTVAVRVAVPNADRALKPGMFGTAEIAVHQSPGAPEGGAPLVVPRDAVHELSGAKVVFVPAGENRFRAVKVETGRSSAGDVEIVSGLSPGQPVVTRGSFTLKAELSRGSMGHAGHAH